MFTFRLGYINNNVNKEFYKYNGNIKAKTRQINFVMLKVYTQKLLYILSILYICASMCVYKFSFQIENNI